MYYTWVTTCKEVHEITIIILDFSFFYTIIFITVITARKYQKAALEKEVNESFGIMYLAKFDKLCFDDKHLFF